MPIDLSALWDFQNPALSEERFTAALATASGDEELVLRTQIARTWGLRREFERARDILVSLKPLVATAGPEVRVRHALELGRTFASAAHAPDALTPEAKASAREAYLRAYEIARAANLDGLAIDALHMMAMVDTAPEDQLKWGLEAIAVMEASTQPAAKKWEASLRNNVGYALGLAGRHEEALVQFRLALAERERSGNSPSIRIAHWMIAKTLRELGRVDEALTIQLRLEQEWAAAGAPDPYVFGELELLYRAKGDEENAARCAQRASVG